MLILPPELISISEPALKIAAFLDVEASFLRLLALNKLALTELLV